MVHPLRKPRSPDTRLELVHGLQPVVIWKEEIARDKPYWSFKTRGLKNKGLISSNRRYPKRRVSLGLASGHK
jgi:hypothetical protein